MKLVEKVGSGLKRIREMCADQNCPQPIIEADKDLYRITFTRIGEGLTKDFSEGGLIGGSIGRLMHLTDRQREIVNLIKANPAITVKTLAEQLQINRSAVDKHLDALKRKGTLLRVGGTRGHWEIKKKEK